ncbi:MAG: phosphoribosylamine--glycine ligase [Bacteroidetes bacterium]|nr:phosphoribosylamine--glycine ligase [Bacteroidota bacterium]
MNVLVIGSGGREHALTWKISQSKHVERLFIAPGNAGTLGHGYNIDLDISDFGKVEQFVTDNGINMVIVGPEAPLVEGIRDYFLANPLLSAIPVIGPGKQAAMLEGSKDFAKDFMKRHNIPTAAYATFKRGETEDACKYLRSLTPPYVIKADGLAAGKGVLICDDLEEACHETKSILENNKFGQAGDKVVIEEFLRGIELSVFIITDGNSYILLPEAKDYKRIGEGDTGLNTGGMGSVSPVPFADKAFMHKVVQRIINPTVNGLKQDGIDYRGFIFFGLINSGGDPYVIEYNARMGDPEAESIIPRISSDIMDLFDGVAHQTLHQKKIGIDPRASAAIMLVSGGYPGSYSKGKPIHGLENVDGSLVFHAGTAFDADAEKIITAGGRVIAVTSLAESLEEALKMSYNNISKISFDAMYYRQDIGQDLLKS